MFKFKSNLRFLLPFTAMSDVSRSKSSQLCRWNPQLETPLGKPPPPHPSIHPFPGLISAHRPPRSVSHCLSVELMNLSWGVLFLPACRCRRQSALQADSRAARQAQVRGAPRPHPPFITDSHAEPPNAWIAAQRQSDIVIPARGIPAVPSLIWLSPGFYPPPLPPQNPISVNNSK